MKYKTFSSLYWRHTRRLKNVFDFLLFIALAVPIGEVQNLFCVTFEVIAKALCRMVIIMIWYMHVCTFFRILSYFCFCLIGNSPHESSSTELSNSESFASERETRQYCRITLCCAFKTWFLWKHSSLYQSFKWFYSIWCAIIPPVLFNSGFC